MANKKRPAHRLVAVLAATIVTVSVGGLTMTGEAHAAKCIPGSGNPLNPCP